MHVVPTTLVFASPFLLSFLAHIVVADNGEVGRWIAGARATVAGGAGASGILASAASIVAVPSASVFAGIFLFAFAQLVLMHIIPGGEMLGSVAPGGYAPSYQNNGVSCYLLSWAVGALAVQQGWIRGDEPFIHFPAMVVAASVIAVVVCAALYVKGLVAPSTTDAGTNGYGPIFDFFWGTELHPRAFGVAIKQWVNCRISMTAWPMLCASYAIGQYYRLGYVTPGMFVSVVLQALYILKFFMWESGYVRSMDIQHDRAGFYIIWGCLAWVPGTYTFASYVTAATDSGDMSLGAAATLLLVGLVAIYLNWDADDQRQRVTRTGGKCLVWGKPPQVIRASYRTADGELHHSILLHSGWWGISRHFHYIAEITAAVTWCLPGMLHYPIAWFYPVFLTILLVDRAYRDEIRCAAKYGKFWEKYCSLVPYRIVPYIY